MSRPVLTRIAACLTAGLLAAVAGPVAGPAHAVADETTPLSVRVDSLLPAEITANGTLDVTGQIVNESDETWTNLNVYLLTSPTPFTTSEELVEAQQSDPATEIGGRLTDPGLFEPVGDLPPGSSVDFALSVAREDLEITGEPGVYWLAVHVLGASGEGRDSVADGRARTFVPLMERDGPSTSMSLVMPLRAEVRRGPRGRLREVRAWHELLSAEGRLGRLLELTGTSVGLPVTWVLDPSVVDAARSVAQGNPPMSIAPTDDQADIDPMPGDNETDGSATASPEGGPTEDESQDVAPDDPGDDPAEESPEPSEEPEQATDWLDTFRRQSDQHTVLTVPYGGLDVASALGQGFGDLLAEATRRSSQAMAAAGVRSSPVVAPATGLLPRAALRRLEPETPVLLSDSAVPGSRATVVETENDHRVVLSRSSVKTGGPGPTPPYRALALRQRFLSEAAVHALSPQRGEPLVVSTPQLWDPGSDWRLAAFFSGFDVPWLRTVDLPTVTSTSVPPDRPLGAGSPELRYPQSEARDELPLANLLATEELVETGDVFADLLTRNDTVDEFLAGSAMLASSYRARKHPNASVEMARQTTAYVRSRMARVRVETPSFVTMSSGEGPFAITVVNDLDEPVTVGIDADTGSSELVIASPEPVSVGPGQRATVRLLATSTDIGLHSVSVVATNSNGHPLGDATTFNIRSSQVGLVIWVIMGLGAAVLFVAIGFRLVKRVRARRAAHDRLVTEGRR